MGSLNSQGTWSIVRGNLNGVWYIDILGECMVPSVHMHGYRDHYIFQNDNAPCHRARIVNEWKVENNISSLQWPAQSPDLNPIDNLWSQLGRMIHRDPPTDLADLERKIHENWAMLGRRTCLDLIRSMPLGVSRSASMLQVDKPTIRCVTNIFHDTMWSNVLLML